MAKVYLTLQQSEGYVILAASQIYAAYIAAGRVEDGKEAPFIEKAIRDAMRIARTVETNVIAEGEMDS